MCSPARPHCAKSRFTATCCQPTVCYEAKKTASYAVPICVNPRGPCNVYQQYVPNCPPCAMPTCSPYSSCQPCCPPCPPCLDDEENFIESLIPFVRCMTKIKKMQLRVLFQNILYEVMVDNAESFCMPLNSVYKPSKPICTQDEDEIFMWGLIPHLKTLNPEKRLLTRKRFFDTLYKVYVSSDSLEKTNNIDYEMLEDRIIQQEKVMKNRNALKEQTAIESVEKELLSACNALLE